MNQEFQNCHENFIQKNSWIFETIAGKVEEKKNMTISREILCLICTQIYIRVQIINKQISATNHKRKHNKKKSKFTNCTTKLLQNNLNVFMFYIYI